MVSSYWKPFAILDFLQASSGSAPYPKSWLGICILHIFPFGDWLVSSCLKLSELMPILFYEELIPLTSSRLWELNYLYNINMPRNWFVFSPKKEEKRKRKKAKILAFAACWKRKNTIFHFLFRVFCQVSIILHN